MPDCLYPLYGGGIGRGHVRKWNDTDWNQLGSDIDGEASGDRSGRSVSLSADGTTLAIGAPYNDRPDTPTNSDHGHVRIFEWNQSAWNQMGKDIDAEAAGDLSGHSVSLSSDGTTVALPLKHLTMMALTLLLTRGVAMSMFTSLLNDNADRLSVSTLP